MIENRPTGANDRLPISAAPSTAGGALLLLAVFGWLGRRVFRLPPGAALVGAALATALHFVSELWHQSGHARAAAETGYPMSGVRLWGVLGTSLYPADEPELPPEIHARRALGGPRASAWFAALGGLAVLLTRPRGRRRQDDNNPGGEPGGGPKPSVAFMVSTLFALENLLVFSLGALFPLPFMETDGGTLRRYRRGHRKRMVVIQE
jgi:hypothetical protein